MPMKLYSEVYANFSLSLRTARDQTDGCVGTRTPPGETSWWIVIPGAVAYFLPHAAVNSKAPSISQLNLGLGNGS